MPPGSLWRVAASLTLLTALPAVPSLAAQAWLPRVEISAGGGFTGVRNAEVAQRNAVDCNAANQCTPVAGMVDLSDKSHYVWKPALASGLVFRWTLPYVKNHPNPDDQFGIGFGGQMVFGAQEEGTRLLPALTFHAGTKKTQLFFGFAFGSSDVVKFPNGVKGVRVPSGSTQDFVQTHGGKKPIYFVGIVIDGLAVTGNGKT